MWVRDTNFGTDDGTTKNFRVPVGIGKSLVTFDGNPALQINVGDLHGAQRIPLDVTQMPPHQHLVANGAEAVPGNNLTSGNNLAYWGEAGGDSHSYLLLGTSSDPDRGLTSSTGGTGSPAAVVSHDNMPPCIGVIFAKRSARQFYAI
jgi:microcystin-dependent protein